MQQAELLEKRKEVLEKKIEAELNKAKLYLKQGNKAGTFIPHVKFPEKVAPLAAFGAQHPISNQLTAPFSFPFLSILAAATTCMKKKALLVKQMEGLDNNIMRVTEQQNMLEDAQMHVQTVAAMQQAAKAQKATMAEFKIEKVDQVMDEIQNVADQAAEIQQALAMPLGGAVGIDDDDIEAELAELESQQLDEELLQPALIPSTVPPARDELQLPSVPTTAAPAGRVKKTADEELEEMMRELA